LEYVNAVSATSVGMSCGGSGRCWRMSVRAGVGCVECKRWLGVDNWVDGGSVELARGFVHQGVLLFV
jgi:hypothetical protein